MRYMITYDLMETIRNTNQWLGASALAMGSYPAFAMVPNPALSWITAWGEVTERTFQRMIIKPDWNIPPVPSQDAQDHLVTTEVVVQKDFGDLLHFVVADREPPKQLPCCTRAVWHGRVTARKFWGQRMRS